MSVGPKPRAGNQKARSRDVGVNRETMRSGLFTPPFFVRVSQATPTDTDVSPSLSFSLSAQLAANGGLFLKAHPK
jgi:hypothetical protein